MTFASRVFLVAGIYGLAVLVPQYFLEERNGIDYPPPINHPEYFYGFVGVAVAWQIAFLIIAKDPIRYRPLMLAAVVEKATFAIATVVLYMQGRIATAVLGFGVVDMILGTLFAVAFIKTRADDAPSRSRPRRQRRRRRT